MTLRTVVICLGLLCVGTAFAASPAHEIAVMVTLDGLSLDQLARPDIPEFRHLVESGAIGLMNNKTDGSQTFENNAVTIGAGARGVGYEHATYGFNAQERIDGEPAKRVFERNTGIEVPDTAIVHTKIVALQSLNSTQRYEIVPGLLGQALQDAGVAVAVFGNTDQGKLRSRSSVAIAMNARGWVPHGDVGRRTLARDPQRPFGVRTNYDHLLESVETLERGRSFVVMEVGDSGRVEASRTELSPQRYEHFKRLALAECGRFLAALDGYLKGCADRYLLAVVVSAQGSAAYEKGDRLTPVLLIGTGITPGLLSSSSTKRPGLITNLDLAPTFLRFFEVEQEPSMSGTPAAASRHPDPLGTLKRMNDQIVVTFGARTPVLTAYVIFVALGVILAVLSVVLHGRIHGCAELISKPSFLRPLLTALILAPAALWVAPGLGIYGALPSGAFVVITTLAAAHGLNRWIKEPRLVFAAVGIGLAAMLCADLLAGASLLKRSILGYDPVVGIRFYGIGNEYTGVLMGAALLGLYSVLDYRPRRWTWLALVILCLGIVVLLGAPTYGTNFGGMLAVLCAFGFALVKVREPRSWLRTMAWAGAGAIVLVSLVVVSNSLLAPEQQTHIGRAFAQARHSGPGVLFDLAIRKWGMNLRLMKYSIWTYAMVSLIVGLVVLFHRPVGIVRRTLRKHPSLNAGFMGILVGIIVAMFTNDSGVAMAATSLLYLTVPLMIMAKVELCAADESQAPADLVSIAQLPRE